MDKKKIDVLRELIASFIHSLIQSLNAFIEFISWFQTVAGSWRSENEHDTGCAPSASQTSQGDGYGKGDYGSRYGIPKLGLVENILSSVLEGVTIENCLWSVCVAERKNGEEARGWGP